MAPIGQSTRCRKSCLQICSQIFFGAFFHNYSIIILTIGCMHIFWYSHFIKSLHEGTTQDCSRNSSLLTPSPLGDVFEGYSNPFNHFRIPWIRRRCCWSRCREADDVFGVSKLDLNFKAFQWNLEVLRFPKDFHPKNKQIYMNKHNLSGSCFFSPCFFSPFPGFWGLNHLVTRQGDAPSRGGRVSSRWRHVGATQGGAGI